MSKMKMIPFTLVLNDSTSKFTKIKKQDYLGKGTYKIIDQGQSFIAGFTNDANSVSNFDSEVIIFGDHTRIFKFINFPVAIGADGVKVLEVKNKDEFDIKFLYYYLKSVKLHDAGYSRHFKFLKEIKIPVLPLADQQKISKLLSQIEELIIKREKSIKLLDELTKSIFLDIFGDPGINQKKWPVKKLGEHIEYIGDIGSNGSNANITANLEMFNTQDYAIMIRTVNLNANDFKNNIKYVSKKTYDYFKKSKIYGGEIIMNKIGSAGKIWIMPNLNRPVSLGLNQLMIRLKKLNTNYLYFLLSTDFGQMIINSKVKGAVTKSITKGAVKELPLLYPPPELQNKFEKILIQIEQVKTIYQNSLKELNNLFASIAQKAFKGELDVSKIHLDITKQKDANMTLKLTEDNLIQEIKSGIFKIDNFVNKDQHYYDVRDMLFKMLEDGLITQEVYDVEEINPETDKNETSKKVKLACKVKE